jgi:ribosomal protein S18
VRPEPTRPHPHCALQSRAEQTARHNDTRSKLFSAERWCAPAPNSSSSTQRHLDGRADGKAQRHLVQAVQRCKVLPGTQLVVLKHVAPSRAEQTAKHNDTWSKLFSTERCAVAPNSSSSRTQRHPDGRADGKAQRHLVQAVQRCKVRPGTQLVVLKHAAPSRRQSRRQSTTTPGPSCSALRGAPWIPTRPQARSTLPTAGTNSPTSTLRPPE